VIRVFSTKSASVSSRRQLISKTAGAHDQFSSTQNFLLDRNAARYAGRNSTNDPTRIEKREPRAFQRGKNSGYQPISKTVDACRS